MELDLYHRPHSRLGLHLPPSSGLATNDMAWALDKMQQMRCAWATIMDDGGGSSMEINPNYGKSTLQMLLDRGIEPIVRIYASPHAHFDARMMDTARRLKEAGVYYLFYINEPEVGGTEWGDHLPKDWVEIVTRNCVDFAYQVIPMGLYPGFWATTTWQFPDPNGNLINPLLFYMTQREREDLFVNGPSWWAIHPYSKNHPIDYPFDDVNVLGTPMTHAEYQAKLDEVDLHYRQTQHLWVFDDYQTSEHHINLLRTPHPDASLRDDVCFNMFRGFNEYILKPAGLLDYCPIIATELGPCVGDRDDGRYPKVTPQTQIKMSEMELRIATATPNVFGLTFWISGCQRLDIVTKDSFEDQSWWTDRHNEPFNLQGEMPIVPHLIASQTMTSKLGFHIQEYSTLVADAITTVQPSTVKIMGNALNPGVIQDIRQRSPHSLIIGRFWQGQQPYDNPSQQAINLADGIESTGCGPLVDYWESYNEVANNLLNPTQVDLLDQFFLAFQQVIRARWQKKTIIICSPCGNLGWPGEPSPLDFQRSLADADTLVSFHGYEWHYSPADDRVAYLFRPFTLMTQVLAKYPNKKFIFTEMGCTRMAVPGYPNDWGWSYNSADLNGPYSQDEYKQVLQDILAEANKYPSLLGVNIFETGAAGDWAARGFESISEVKEVAMEAILPPIYEVPIRVLIDGTVQTMELENYLTAVVPAEMPALWPMEALKAQAVAARTYALWRIEHPAGATFDLYADARDQVYNPSMIHPNSTAAVQATQGLYVEPQPTRYISKCGRVDCSYCHGSNGYQDKTWDGRLCQNGAQVMAAAGSDYRTILKHYYGDIKFSDEEVIVSPYPVAVETIWGLESWDPTVLVKADVQAGEEYWHFVRVELGPNTMANTLWIDNQDRNAHGVAPDNAMVKIKNADLPIMTLPIKAPPDLQDMAMYKTSLLSMWLEDSKSRKSDRLENIRGDIVGLPDGVNAYHIERYVTVQLCVASGGVVPPESEPDDAFTTEDWQQLNTAQQALIVAQQNIDAIMTRHLH